MPISKMRTQSGPYLEKAMSDAFVISHRLEFGTDLIGPPVERGFSRQRSALAVNYAPGW